MANFSRYSRKHKTGIFLAIYVLISFVCLLFFGPTAKIQPQQAGQAVFSIFQHGISAIGNFVSNTINSIQELKDLKEAHKELQDTLSQYEIINRNYEQIAAENEQLKSVLEFSTTVDFENIPAQIIGKDPTNYYSTLTINKGLKHGVRQNMTVITFQNGYSALVGKIVEAGYLTSMIKPIFDQSSYVAVRFLDSRYDGLLEGTGSTQSLLLRYVNVLAQNELQYNDMIVTAGYNDNFPAELFVGKLKRVLPQKYETSLAAEIEPIVNFGNLEYVYILYSRKNDE